MCFMQTAQVDQPYLQNPELHRPPAKWTTAPEAFWYQKDSAEVVLQELPLAPWAWRNQPLEPSNLIEGYIRRDLQEEWPLKRFANIIPYSQTHHLKRICIENRTLFSYWRDSHRLSLIILILRLRFRKYTFRWIPKWNPNWKTPLKEGKNKSHIIEQWQASTGCCASFVPKKSLGGGISPDFGHFSKNGQREDLVSPSQLWPSPIQFDKPLNWFTRTFCLVI